MGTHLSSVPSERTRNVELRCYMWCYPEQTVEWVVTRDAITPMWHQSNVCPKLTDLVSEQIRTSDTRLSTFQKAMRIITYDIAKCRSDEIGISFIGPWRIWQSYQKLNFQVIIRIPILDIFCEIALRLMLKCLTNEKSTLAQVMAWCRQATSHYLIRWWARSLSLYGIPAHTELKFLKVKDNI